MTEGRGQRVEVRNQKSNSVYLEMVDFGSTQGRSPFATAVVVSLRRGSQKDENAVLGQKMPFPDGH
jgi:hypothetical protein